MRDERLTIASDGVLEAGVGLLGEGVRRLIRQEGVLSARGRMRVSDAEQNFGEDVRQ
jgi:hypothetical protein